MVRICRSDFKFHKIYDNCKENFVDAKVKWPDLSEFHAEALKWIGDAIRGERSQFFWSNGAYCWYTDESQSVEECVWMTANGIAIYEKITEGKLYRIEFVH